jgi:two-component system, cell cycle sensor histidine kinase and response regulator CckA
MIMPVMGGSETFDKLKAMQPALKVLLSSGYAADGQASDILKRGCNGFIQKPFNLEQLSRKTSEALLP